GVDLAQAKEWIQAGSPAVSVGGPLLGDVFKSKDYSGLAERTHNFVESIDSAKGCLVPNIVTLGETMALIRSNIAGHQGSRSQMTLGFGGAESNLSVALTRLGNHVTWLSELGADAFGRMMATELRRVGIDVRAKSLDDAPTGLMVKTSGLAGTQDVTYYRKDSAAARISDSDIPEDLFAGADLFHTSGITLAISKSARETGLAA